MAKLFEPFTLGGVELHNRIMISPMCQYSARGGVANDWHRAQYGRFAMGGAGLVMVEATSVNAQGMGTPGDLGLWTDEQETALAEIARIISALGAVPGIQLGHSGRKAAAQRPWHGSGPLGPHDAAERGEFPWPVVAPSAVAMAEGWQVPLPLDAEGIKALKDDYATATRRALQAGYKVIELHCAHGYLLHEFLSPLSNLRDDDYGGCRENRMRLPLQIAALMRDLVPADGALLVRVSAVDGVEGGIELEDTIAFAQALKAIGVDAVDCSSGGLVGGATAARIPRGPGFQVPFADAIRHRADIPTIAVGLILAPLQAEAILRAGQADLIAIAREALDDPNWPLHARQVLEQDGFAGWPAQSGWWLERRASILATLKV